MIGKFSILWIGLKGNRYIVRRDGSVIEINVACDLKGYFKNVFTPRGKKISSLCVAPI